jgi:hypothetical protein
VVHALERIHAALEPGGLILDTQPVSGRPLVEAAGDRLGALDMREWLGTIAAVDRLVAQTVDDGLYSIDGERRFIVADTWDNGAECVETVRGWQGTRISKALAKRVDAGRAPIRVYEEVRLRLLHKR